MTAKKWTGEVPIAVLRGEFDTVEEYDAHKAKERSEILHFVGGLFAFIVIVIAPLIYMIYVSCTSPSWRQVEAIKQACYNDREGLSAERMNKFHQYRVKCKEVDGTISEHIVSVP